MRTMYWGLYWDPPILESTTCVRGVLEGPLNKSHALPFSEHDKKLVWFSSRELCCLDPLS